MRQVRRLDLRKEVHQPMKLRQQIAGYHLPEYLSDVLTLDTAGTFLHMSVEVQENTTVFVYDLCGMEQINLRTMSTVDRIRLMEILLDIDDINEDHLIPASAYLIEPELIYCRNHQLTFNSVRILFYPDTHKKDFMYKWGMSAFRILRPEEVRESDLLTRLRHQMEVDGSRAGIRRLLQRTAKRLEE